MSVGLVDHLGRMAAATLHAAAPPPRDEIRSVAEQVFDRDEFVQRKSLWQRIVDWFSDLFPERRATSGGGGGISSAGNLVLYVALALLLALLAILIVRVFRGRVRRAPRADDLPVITMAVPRSTEDWRSEAERLEAEGRWKDAMLARYRELVGTLVDDRVLSNVPGRTTGELRLELAAEVSEAAGWFDEATTLFELPWYADVVTGPEQSHRFSSLAVRILDAASRRNRLVAP